MRGLCGPTGDRIDHLRDKAWAKEGEGDKWAYWG